VESGNFGKWRMSSGEWKVRNKYGIVVQSGEWKVGVESGKWRVKSKVESGESGEWKNYEIEINQAVVR
jgi:hypothetical protein